MYPNYLFITPYLLPSCNKDRHFFTRSFSLCYHWVQGSNIRPCIDHIFGLSLHSCIGIDPWSGHIGSALRPRCSRKMCIPVRNDLSFYFKSRVAFVGAATQLVILPTHIPLIEQGGGLLLLRYFMICLVALSIFLIGKGENRLPSPRAKSRVGIQSTF